MASNERALLEALEAAGYKVIEDSGWVDAPDSDCRCQKCETIVRLQTELRLVKRLFRAKVDLTTLTDEEKRLVSDIPDVVFYRRPDDVDVFRAIKVEINYQRFCWRLTNKHYECVHGLFRVLLMLPDKLATALRIRELELPDPEDDGQFLIRLVLNLLEHYIELSARIENVDGDDPLVLLEAEYTFPEFYGIPGPAAQNVNFHESLTHLKVRLTSLLSKLPLRNLALDMHIGDILIWADFARLACLAYLKFAHPICVISSRLREFDRQVADDKRRALLQEAAQRSLAEDFANFRRV